MLNCLKKLNDEVSQWNKGMLQDVYSSCDPLALYFQPTMKNVKILQFAVAFKRTQRSDYFLSAQPAYESYPCVICNHHPLFMG